MFEGFFLPPTTSCRDVKDNQPKTRAALVGPQWKKLRASAVQLCPAWAPYPFSSRPMKTEGFSLLTTVSNGVHPPSRARAPLTSFKETLGLGSDGSRLYNRIHRNLGSRYGGRRRSTTHGGGNKPLRDSPSEFWVWDKIDPIYWNSEQKQKILSAARVNQEVGF